MLADCNNLVAASTHFNQVYIASERSIQVYAPERLSHGLGKPVTKISPKKGLSTYVGMTINNIAVGELGSEEVLVCVQDDGGVTVWATRDLSREIFYDNVGSSAWGIATHKETRRLAISSNSHTIKVYELGLSENERKFRKKYCSGLFEERTEHGASKRRRLSDVDESFGEGWDGWQIPPHKRASSPDDITYEAWRVLMWRQSRVIGKHDHNIPTLSFLNDKSGRWLASGGIDYCFKVWDLTANKCVAVHKINPSTRAWTVLFLGRNAFLPVNSIQEALGAKHESIPRKEQLQKHSTQRFGNSAADSNQLAYDLSRLNLQQELQDIFPTTTLGNIPNLTPGMFFGTQYETEDEDEDEDEDSTEDYDDSLEHDEFLYYDHFDYESDDYEDELESMLMQQLSSMEQWQPTGNSSEAEWSDDYTDNDSDDGSVPGLEQASNTDGSIDMEEGDVPPDLEERSESGASSSGEDGSDHGTLPEPVECPDVSLVSGENSDSYMETLSQQSGSGIAGSHGDSLQPELQPSPGEDEDMDSAPPELVASSEDEDEENDESMEQQEEDASSPAMSDVQPPPGLSSMNSTLLSHLQSFAQSLNNAIASPNETESDSESDIIHYNLGNLSVEVVGIAPNAINVSFGNQNEPLAEQSLTLELEFSGQTAPPPNLGAETYNTTSSVKSSKPPLTTVDEEYLQHLSNTKPGIPPPSAIFGAAIHRTLLLTSPNFHASTTFCPYQDVVPSDRMHLCARIPELQLVFLGWQRGQVAAFRLTRCGEMLAYRLDDVFPRQAEYDKLQVKGPLLGIATAPMQGMEFDGNDRSRKKWQAVTSRRRWRLILVYATGVVITYEVGREQDAGSQLIF